MSCHYTEKLSNGYLSPDEVDWFKEKGQYFDKNKDGAISLQEWNAVIGLKKNPKYKEGDIEENTKKKLFALSVTLYKAKEYINNSPPTHIISNLNMNQAYPD